MLNKLRVNKYINKHQSLKYQIMILLMEEHRKARLGGSYIGVYLGDDRLIFDEISWGKMKVEIKKNISETYSQLFGEMTDNEILTMLYREESDFFDFEITEFGEIDGESKVFSISNKGYSYQYNGYVRATEKLQNTANKILLATLVYYFLSLIFEYKEIIVKIFQIILNVLKKIDFKIEIIPTVIVVFGVLFILLKGINKIKN